MQCRGFSPGDLTALTLRGRKREVSSHGYPRLRGFNYRASRSYFVTFCVLGRYPIFSYREAALIARDSILHYRTRGWYALHAYCVMPDHIHLVLKLLGEGRSLSAVVGTLKSVIFHRSRLVGRRFAWQHGFHDRIVREHEKSDEFIGYVLRNPLRAGLVSANQAYQFSEALDAWF